MYKRLIVNQNGKLKLLSWNSTLALSAKLLNSTPHPATLHFWKS